MCPCVSHYMFISAYRVNFSKSYNFTLQHISRCKNTQQKALHNFAVVAWRYSIILRRSRVLYFTYSKHRPLLSLCKLMSSPVKEFRNNFEMLPKKLIAIFRRLRIVNWHKMLNASTIISYYLEILWKPEI